MHCTLGAKPARCQLSPRSPRDLTVPGSLLSAVEVLRADLFCSPVETAMRKQKLRSLLPGMRARGTGGWALRPGSGLESGEDTSQPKQGDGFGKQTTGGLRPKKPLHCLQAREQVGAGRKATLPADCGKWGGWSFSRDGASAIRDRQRCRTWMDTL